MVNRKVKSGFIFVTVLLPINLFIFSMFSAVKFKVGYSGREIIQL